ncbi:sensor histidine kinase [Sphingobacterium sp. MYb382]|uniref:sensor histidine kinase n=1 Tax=Sphingobacterium sp. MYb382 TaxID=2745278 RepID=UPI0030A8B606
MKIATRTALMYSALTAGILLLFAYIILLVSLKNQREEFFDRLGYKLTWRAEFFFDAAIEEDLFRLLHERNKTLLNEADISIYDADKKLIFSDMEEPLGPKWVWEKLAKQPKVQWEADDYQLMAESYSHKDKTYYIFGKAKDQTGAFYMNRLRNSIILVYILALVIISGVGFWFSYYSLRPIKQIIAHIRDISEQHLDRRLHIPKAKDELYELTETFNTTFNRLEQSFSNHKSFVTTLSHEFRTPLTSLIAELQLANELNVTVDDYKQSIDHALSEAQRATDLSSALLDLAKANFDVSQITFTTLRVDEILVEAKLNVLSKHEDYTVPIHYKELSLEEGSAVLEFEGNPYLLMVAFINLIENACKYSANRTCTINLSAEKGQLLIQFSDTGIGIPLADQSKIFNLFYRGHNKAYNSGNGIGLNIVQQILHVHKAALSLASEEGIGSTFSVMFPKEKKA